MNNSYFIGYSPEALNDLKEIYSHIAISLQVPETAKKQTNRIRKKIRSLNFMPSRHPIVDWEPWQSMKMHQVSVDNFLIFYTVDKHNLTVTIIRIFYAGRDIRRIINEGNE